MNGTVFASDSLFGPINLLTLTWLGNTIYHDTALIYTHYVILLFCLPRPMGHARSPDTTMTRPIIVMTSAMIHDIGLRTIFSTLRARRSYHAPLIEKRLTGTRRGRQLNATRDVHICIVTFARYDDGYRAM